MAATDLSKRWAGCSAWRNWFRSRIAPLRLFAGDAFNTLPSIHLKLGGSTFVTAAGKVVDLTPITVTTIECYLVRIPQCRASFLGGYRHWHRAEYLMTDFLANGGDALEEMIEVVLVWVSL